MNNNKISLAIFGNQNSNSGFQPLYWINDPPQQLENIVPPGMDENPYFFTLQVLPTHTQYTLIHNRVSSYMSVRPGVLKMAIAIPKGYIISDGISPLEVLLAVRQAFIDTCMTLRDTHAEAYNFKEKLADPGVFTSIVDAYELVTDTQAYQPMRGTEDALMLLDDVAIAHLFAAPQHSEFTPFKRIIIANKGNASVYKTQLNGIAASTANEMSDVPTQQLDSPKEQSKTPQNNLDSEKKDLVFQNNKTDFAKNKPALNKKHIIALLCCLFIIGGAVFLILPSSEKKTEKTALNEEYESEEEEEPEEEEISETEILLKKAIKEKQRQLEDSMLTFDDINILTEWANMPVDTEVIGTVTMAKYNDIKQQILVYDTLRIMCSKHEYNGLWKYTKEQKELFNTALDSLYATGYLNEIHYHYLQAAYMVAIPCHDEPGCYNNIKWTDDNRDKLEVFQNFLINRDRRGLYDSFKKVYDVALGHNSTPVVENPSVTTPTHIESNPKPDAKDKTGELSADDDR